MDQTIFCRFVVPMIPISVNRMKGVFRGRAIKSREAREFETAFNHYLAEFAQQAIHFIENFDVNEHAAHVSISVYLPKEKFFTASGKIHLRRLDVDNAAKCVLDQVFRFLNIDDGLVTKLIVSKYPSDRECTEIVVKIAEKPKSLYRPATTMSSSVDTVQ